MFASGKRWMLLAAALLRILYNIGKHDSINVEIPVSSSMATSFRLFKVISDFLA